MLNTLNKITDIIKSTDNKPIDNVRAYLILTEILKVLYENNIIHFTSYMHFQWKADFQIMCDELIDVSRGTMISLIAEKYNRSTKAVEMVIYNLRKEKIRNGNHNQ